jgi:uncharacterized RDD family membrane protein YckC
VTIASDSPAQALDAPRYGRFLRRFQAALIDLIVMIVAIYTALFIAVTLNSDNLARTIGFSVAAGWLLYEPLLVWATGSTVGHYFRNLRVVDDKTGGNISFGKAVVRTVIKALLSWLSFISMATTRRHQAVHDLVTGSTVQLRNPGEASPEHYSGENIELSAAGMPSRGRRLAVIGLYLAAGGAVFVLALWGLMSAGYIAQACILDDRCTAKDENLILVLIWCWLGASIACVIMGWRGRLLGSRVRQAGP